MKVLISVRHLQFVLLHYLWMGSWKFKIQNHQGLHLSGKISLENQNSLHFLNLMECFLFNHCLHVVHNYTKIKGLHSRKITSLPTYMRHLSHRRNKLHSHHETHFHTMKSRHDSYPQFPRSSLGTRSLQTRSHRKKIKVDLWWTRGWSKLCSTTNVHMIARFSIQLMRYCSKETVTCTTNI